MRSSKMAWARDPNSGGVKITPARQRETAERVFIGPNLESRFG
jgi:hypothetical protein